MARKIKQKPCTQPLWLPSFSGNDIIIYSVYTRKLRVSLVPFSLLVHKFITKNLVNSFYTFPSHFLNICCHHPIPIPSSFPYLFYWSLQSGPPAPPLCSLFTLQPEQVIVLICRYDCIAVLVKTLWRQPINYSKDEIQQPELGLQWPSDKPYLLYHYQPVTVLFQFFELNTISFALKYVIPSITLFPLFA